MKHFWGIFLILLYLISSPVSAGEFIVKRMDAVGLKELRKGGYVLYLRHGPTDSSRHDLVDGFDLNDCQTQRPLTEEGRQIIAKVGQAIRKAEIPYDTVVSSPLCRAKDSAYAAFGEKVEVDVYLKYSGNMTTEEKKPVVARTRELISLPVKAGVNRILVAHAPNLMDVMGYFPKPEGTLVIFRPLGPKGFEYLGSIFPEDWGKILK